MNNSFVRLTVFAFLLIGAVIALLPNQRESEPFFAPPAAPPAEIVFGANLELSGKFAALGKASLSGIQMAIDEINRGGGLLGKPVRLAIADNRSDETSASAVFHQLTQQDHVVGIIGPVYSTTAIASGTLADTFKIPFIATLATNPRVTIDDNGRVRPFAFRICFIDSFQGTAMANFALTALQARSAAIYIDDSAYYAQGLASFFEQAFMQKGGQILAKAGYSPQTKDFKPKLDELLAPSPDVLFIPGYYTEVAKIIALARSSGFNKPIIGGDGWEEQLLVNAIGPAALNNTFYCSHYSPGDDSPAIQNFISSYQIFTKGSEPIQASVMAYDATMLLADAIRRAAEPDQQKIRDALAATINFPAVSGLIRFDNHHNPEKNAVVIEIRNGKGQFKQRISP
ncbi:ABC transporter substrate-binding protein [Azotosporobacter soli]|uniref:ABC transporter substrate-binding protein n=1 Tax=Azotosporobacter soli TaxID=3055040 RepID=UPI0031FE6007